MTSPHDEPEYRDDADLSFRVGKGGPRVQRVNDLPLRFSLPWPMTRAGGIVFVLCGCVLILGGLAGALWLGWQVFDPSLLRLLPAVVFVLLVKFVLVPALHRFGRRPGMDRRPGGSA